MKNLFFLMVKFDNLGNMWFFKEKEGMEMGVWWRGMEIRMDEWIVLEGVFCWRIAVKNLFELL